MVKKNIGLGEFNCGEDEMEIQNIRSNQIPIHTD